MSHSISRRAAAAVLGGAMLPAWPHTRGGQPIRIGRSMPLSGHFAHYGQMRVTGSQAFIEQVNAAGGIGGRPLEILTLDDGHDASRMKQNIVRLDEGERVLALFGMLGTLGPNLGEFGARGLPLVAATAGVSLRKPPLRHVFPMRAGFAEETAAIVKHMVTRGLRKVAIVHSSDAMGTIGSEGYAQALAREKMIPIASISMKLDGSDTREAAARLAASACDCALLALHGHGVAHLVRAYAGRFPPAYAFSSVNTDLLITELGDKAAGIGVSQVVPSPGNTKFAVVRDYARLMEAGGLQASLYGLESYLEARLLVAGLQRAAAAGPLTRESITRAFDSLGEVDFGGYRVTYGPGVRTGSTFVDLTFVASGGKVRS